MKWLSLARSDEKEAPNPFKKPLRLIEDSNLKTCHFGGKRKGRRL